MNRSRCSTAGCDSPPAPGCLALVWCIVTIGSVPVRGWAAVGTPEEATFCRTCAGILHAMKGPPRMQFSSVHPPLHQPIMCVPLDPKRQEGGNPVRDGPAIPSSESLCVASLNARRLWQRDQSVHDGFRVFSDFLLENHVAFAFRRCSLAISRRYPLISHTYTMVLWVPEDEAAFRVRAGVCGSPVPGVIQPVSGGGCSTMFGASVHTVLLMQGCHRRPVSAFGGILSLLLSVCRMQSAFQWSSPETPTCGILISTSQSRSCDVPIIPFLDLLMASCRLELCNPPDRATHISGAGLDCIFISSGHVVDVVVHDGLQCCTGSLVCCPSLGSFLVRRSLSVSSHASRPSWTNIAATTCP